MEALLSAVASDLVGQLISFLINKLQEPSSTDDDDVGRLQRALLRAHVVIEEAEARQVTSRAMLLQLNQLRGEMCRGAYVLDALTMRAVEPSRRRSHATASRSLVLPPGPGSDARGGLSVVVDNLEAALSDMGEFVVLLGGCPRVGRQPYNAYLFMETCMFGRQMEKEQIVSFLLQPAQDLEVLPVIGPHKIGKQTVVEHACLEERVREKFAKIRYLSSDDLNLASHEHRHKELIDTAARSLFVIDLAGGDKDEECWRGFRSSVRRRAHGEESKVVIISRTEAHSGLGTVPPLRLRKLRREELWYFFRALAFGGADPEERPELLRIAMALFAGIPDLSPFASVNKIAASLRADLSARSWRRVLKVSAGVTVLQQQLGAGEGWTIYYPRVLVKGAPDAPCLFYGGRKSTSMARSELPTVARTTMLEVGHGGVVVWGGEKRFDVLVWQSRIRPYASYVATCDMARAAQVDAGKKRPLNKRRDPNSTQLVRGSGEDKVGVGR